MNFAVEKHCPLLAYFLRIFCSFEKSPMDFIILSSVKFFSRGFKITGPTKNQQE